MDILEELRKQTASEQYKADKPEALAGEMTTYQHSVLLSSLKKVHDYLHELTSKLNQLHHTTTVEIQIPGYGAISNLRQNNYELLWENRANQNRVTLSFCTNVNDACPIKLGNPDSDNIAALLKKSGISFLSNQDDITLNGKIDSAVSFLVKRDECNISLIINNIQQLGKQCYALNEKLINENFFDQLGRFLLHRDNHFIDLISSDTSMQIEPVAEEGLYEPDSGFHTQEMDISRVKSLFSREVQLYLTYHNAIKEINTRSADFIIGRSRQCNIAVNSDLASRQHAKIVYRKGKYVLIDQSTNGTFVKTQGGKEIYVQGEELPLSGSGFISLGKSITVDNEHIIYFSCH